MVIPKVWIISRFVNDTDQAETVMLWKLIGEQISTIVAPHQFDCLIDNDGVRLYHNGLFVKNMPKIVVVRQGSAITSHQLHVLRALETCGTTVINRPDAIERVKSKANQGIHMRNSLIPTPKFMLLRHDTDVSVVEQEIGFPCVVKLHSGSFGKGVTLIKNRQQFVEFVEMINSLPIRYTELMLAQEFIEESSGKDIRVIVVDGKPIGAMQRIAQPGEFRANINQGGHGEKMKLTRELKRLCKKVASVFQLSICGVDLIETKDGYTVIEVNANPGFTGFHQYCSDQAANEIANFVKGKLNEQQ